MTEPSPNAVHLLTVPPRSFLLAFAEKLVTTAGVRLSAGIGKWLVVLHAAKNLGSEDFARLAAMLSLAEILRVVADCGTEANIYSRIRGHLYPMPQFVKACFYLRTTVTVLVMAVAALVCASIESFSGTLVLLALVPVLSLQSSALILLQRHFSRLRLAILIGVAVAATGSAAAAIYMVENLGITGHAVLLVIPEAAVMIAALLLAKKPIEQLLKGYRIRTTKALKAVRPLLMISAAGSILVVATARLDIWIVMPLLGAAQQVNYSSGLRFIEPANMLVAYASTAFLAELGVRGRIDINAKVQTLLGKVTGMNVMRFVAVQVALGFFVFGAATVVFGLPEQAALVSTIFALLLPIKVVSASLAAMLNRIGRIDRVFVATIINFGVVIVLSFTLGERLGVLWICTATLLGEAASVLYQARTLREQEGFSPQAG